MDENMNSMTREEALQKLADLRAQLKDVDQHQRAIERFVAAKWPNVKLLPPPEAAE